MSRHVLQTKDGGEVMYGYDHRLSEYFLTAFDPEGEVVEETTTPSAIYDYLHEQCGVAYDHPHVVAMRLDLPIPQ